MVVLMLTEGDAMPDGLAEVTGALQLVPRDFAMSVAYGNMSVAINYGNMSVAINTVNGAGKTRGRIESHREELHNV